MIRVSDLTFRPIEDAPKDTFVLLRGPSGYSSNPHRYILGRYVTAYERRDNPNWRPSWCWRDHGNDHVTDGGEMPTEFAEL